MSAVDNILGGRPFTVAVDFDGVCHDQMPDPGKKMGRPMPMCKQVMEDMKLNGFQIIIYSARVQEWKDKKHISDWMDYFGIPYDSIAITKPKADIYLDDHAVRFTSWAQFLKDIVVGDR